MAVIAMIKTTCESNWKNLVFQMQSWIQIKSSSAIPNSCMPSKVILIGWYNIKYLLLIKLKHNFDNALPSQVESLTESIISSYFT